MRNALVIYHASCMDGFAAAWAAYHHMVKMSFDNIEFLQADYEDPIPDMTDKEVYIVDYSWKNAEMFLRKAEKAKKVVIVDHHKEANLIWKDVKLPDHVHYIYDNNKSGCVLSWEYFQGLYREEHTRQYGSLLNFVPTPAILMHIQDRDLWKFELTGTKELHAYMKSCGFLLREKDQGKILDLFVKFIDFYHMDESDKQRWIQDGQVIMYVETVLIKSILERNMMLTDFTVYEPVPDEQDWQPKHTYHGIPVAEMPYELASEAGHLLAEMYPQAAFTLTYETQWGFNRHKFSMRSRRDVGADVGKIATLNGGGGHKHSAAWYAPLWQPLPFDTK